MQMPSVNFSGSNYRYGFNGKELDPEGMGGGQSTYDYGFRIYNPAIAKFLSVDPLAPEYPWYTPYQFAGNSPITFLDLDGLEEIIYHIPQASTVIEIINSESHLLEIYSRVTTPESKAKVHVGQVSSKIYGKGLGWGGTTYTPNQLKELATFVKSMADLMKYYSDNPTEKKDISKDNLEKFEKYSSIFKAVNLTPDEVISSENPIFAIVLNADDVEKFSTNKMSKQEVLKSYVHELDAHLEEILKGAGDKSEDVITQHGKYFGYDAEKKKSGDPEQIALYNLLKTGRSPKPEDYIEGSEADINYKAIEKALKK
jgi:RHS repeat-associated protein